MTQGRSRALDRLADWAVAAALVAIANGAVVGVLAALSASVWEWPPLLYVVPSLSTIAAVIVAQRLAVISSRSVVAVLVGAILGVIWQVPILARPLGVLTPVIFIAPLVVLAGFAVLVLGSIRATRRSWTALTAALVGLLMIIASQWYLWATESLALNGSTGVFGETIQSGPNGIAMSASSAIFLPAFAGVLAATGMAIGSAVTSRRTSAST